MVAYGGQRGAPIVIAYTLGKATFGVDESLDGFVDHARRVVRRHSKLHWIEDHPVRIRAVGWEPKGKRFPKAMGVIQPVLVTAPGRKYEGYHAVVNVREKTWRESKETQRDAIAAETLSRIRRRKRDGTFDGYEVAPPDVVMWWDADCLRWYGRDCHAAEQARVLSAMALQRDMFDDVSRR